MLTTVSVFRYGKKKIKQKKKKRGGGSYPWTAEAVWISVPRKGERERERLGRINELMTVSERQRWRRKTSVCCISDLITKWYHIHKRGWGGGKQSFTKEEHRTATLSSARHRHRKTEGCYTDSWNKGRRERALLMKGKRRSPLCRRARCSVMCDQDCAVHTLFWGNLQFWLHWLKREARFLLDDLLGFDASRKKKNKRKEREKNSTVFVLSDNGGPFRAGFSHRPKWGRGSHFLCLQAFWGFDSCLLLYSSSRPEEFL